MRNCSSGETVTIVATRFGFPSSPTPKLDTELSPPLVAKGQPSSTASGSSVGIRVHELRHSWIGRAQRRLGSRQSIHAHRRRFHRVLTQSLELAVVEFNFERAKVLFPSPAR